MTAAIEARGRAVAAKAVARDKARLAEAIRAMPGCSAEVTDAGVVVIGRGLSRRRVEDARLRSPAELIR